jgi:hypothetical protein
MIEVAVEQAADELAAGEPRAVDEPRVVEDAADAEHVRAAAVGGVEGDHRPIGGGGAEQR